MLPSLQFLDTNVVRSREEEDTPPQEPQAKRRSTGPPCPPELRYEVEEVVNSRHIARGGSARFRTQPSSEEKTERELEFDEIESFTTIEITEEIAKADGEGKADRGQSDGEVIRRGVATTQYRLHTLKSDTTLLHVTGEFGVGEDAFDIPQVNDTVYTNGFVWTSTDPRWTWGVSRHHYIRCSIDVPAGNQVIVDRAPTRLSACDHGDGRTSYFPDVLISAGQFTVLEVSKFKQGGGDGYGELTTDMAQRMGRGATVYVDLRLRLENNTVFRQKGEE